MPRRRSQPDEPISRLNLEVASKSVDGVKSDELGTIMATHYTLLSINAWTAEELRLKFKKILLLKPSKRWNGYKNIYGNLSNGSAN